MRHVSWHRMPHVTLQPPFSYVGALYVPFYLQVLAALFPYRPCRYGDRRTRVSARPCDRDTMSDDAATGALIGYLEVLIGYLGRCDRDTISVNVSD